MSLRTATRRLMTSSSVSSTSSSSSSSSTKGTATTTAAVLRVAQPSSRYVSTFPTISPAAVATSSSSPSLAALPSALLNPVRSSRVAYAHGTVQSRIIAYSLRPFHTSRTANSSSKAQESKKKTGESESDADADADADAPPPKASFRERLKFLTRRYGWWALGVYLAASTVDFSLTFLAIHLLGADHIRSLEASLRKSIGLEQRHDDSDDDNNTSSNQSNGGGNNSAIWTEAVLAYTIHKTLLLPVRVAFTAAVTPSFVKWLVRMGWAKANHQVKAQVGRKAADKAIQDVIKRNAAKGAQETTKHQ